MRPLRIAVLLLALLILIATGGVAVPAPSTSPPTSLSTPAPELLHGITRRLHRLRNIVVTYDRLDDYTPPRKLVAAITHNPINSNLTVNVGRRRLACRFSFLNGRAFYESRFISGNRNLGPLRQIRTYTPQRAESLIWHFHSPNKPMGVIYNSAPLPRVSIIDAALGLRRLGAERWLTRDDIMEMRTTSGARNSLVLTRPHASYTDTWIFQLRPSLAMMEFRIAANSGKDRYRYIIKCSNFQSIHGVDLPGKIVARSLPYGLRGVCFETVVLTNLHYVLGSKLNTPSSYRLTFPKGSMVGDARTGHTWLIESRPRKMSDSAIYRLLKRSDSGATGIPGGLPVEPVVKGGVPAGPGSGAVRPSSVLVPLGVAAHPVRASGASGKWFWWIVVFFSVAGFAVVALVLTRRIRLWKR